MVSHVDFFLFLCFQAFLERYEYTNDVGYLADGTPINRAGNNSLRPPTPPPFAASTAPPPVPPVAPVAAPVPPVAPPATTPPTSSTEVLHGVSFSYSMQKDAYADLEFLNDVGSSDSEKETAIKSKVFLFRCFFS